ncbi:MAG: hypothetical protein QOH25_1068 [Acidobacteriota bacterium]|jgi:hypothetical protein|nr:hypothetical protein [Acidobacteriota bacterium]
MSPLRGLTIYSILIPTADAVGYCYVAPPGLKKLLPLSDG